MADDPVVDRCADPAVPKVGPMRPLDFAARTGHADVAELLLDAGAPVNAASYAGQTALGRAAQVDPAPSLLFLPLSAVPSLD